MPQLPGRASRVGLSISDTTVHAVEVNGRGRSSVITASAVAAVPPGVVDQGSVRDVAGFAEVLDSLWSESRIRSRNVVVGLAPHEAFVRAVDLPRLRRRDRRSALGFELQDMLPFPTSEAIIDYRQIQSEGDDDTEFDRFLVVAAHEPSLNPVIEAVDRRGLTLRALDVPAFAAVRAARSLRPDSEEAGAVAVVAIGAEVLTVTIHEQGSVRFTRQVPVAQGVGAELSGLLESELSSINAHLGASQGPARVTGRNPVVDAVYTTIEFEGQTPGAVPVGSIEVLGGGPVATALHDGLSLESAVPVHHVAEWPSTDDRAPLDADWVAMGHAIDAPVALAPPWPRVLPDQAVGRRRATIRIAVASGMAGVAVSAALLAVVGPPVDEQVAVVSDLEAQVLQVEGDLASLEGESGQAAELERALETRAEIEATSSGWGAILAALRAGQPAFSGMQSFEAVGADPVSGEPGLLRVSVEALDQRAVEEWLTMFEEMPGLGQPVLEQIASVPGETDGVAQPPSIFTINVTVGDAADAGTDEADDEATDAAEEEA